MRNLSWQFFTLTGSVDAYLLYKDVERLHMSYREREPNPSSPEEVAEDTIH